MSSDETSLLQDAREALGAIEHDLEKCGRVPPETAALVRHVLRQIEAANWATMPR